MKSLNLKKKPFYYTFTDFIENPTFDDHHYSLTNKPAESSKENVVPDGSVPFDNSARRKLLASALQQETKKDCRSKKQRLSNSLKWTKNSLPSVIDSTVNDWKPPSHLETSASNEPLKKSKIRVPFGIRAAGPVPIVPKVDPYINFSTVYPHILKFIPFTQRFLS